MSTQPFGTIPETVREAVGVFHDAKSLEAAADALMEHGFDRSDLSLLASEAAVRDRLGGEAPKAVALEDDPDAPRRALTATEDIGDAEGAVIGGFTYVGAVAAAGALVATGAGLAAAAAGTVLAGGAGGAVGTAIAKWIDDRHAHTLQRQLDAGGLLLWVHLADADHESRALDILRRHGAEDVHAHTLDHGGGG
jgi:hypothetical protein